MVSPRSTRGESCAIALDVRIRAAAEADLADVLQVHTLAFGPDEGATIAALVPDILQDPSAQPVLSLVALQEDRIVGHVLFSAARLAGSGEATTCALLAPLAVLPEHQNQGLGGRLIRDGLERLAAAGVELVFVLGHPGYYRRFGFEPAGRLGFEATHPIPAEHADAWMVQALKPDIIGNRAGRVVCCDALAAPQYWLA